MDIINNKDNLVNELNSIITSYLELNTKNIELNKIKCIDDEKSSKVIEDLNNSLINKDSIISKLNQDKYQYETIINGLNDKIDSIIADKSINDKHSIIVIQANELDKKDRVIEQLQDKLNKYLNKGNMMDDSIKIFTDGACSNNGKNNAKAGIGVYYGENDIRNVSERIDGCQTNNMAELRAIIKVFDDYEYGNKKVTIYSDSKIAIGWCTTCGEKYEKSNWDCKKLNQMGIDKIKYIKEGYNIIKKYPGIKLEHVKAHTTNNDIISIGNRMADKLATESLKIEDIIDINTIINDEQNKSDEVVDEVVDVVVDVVVDEVVDVVADVVVDDSNIKFIKTKYKELIELINNDPSLKQMIVDKIEVESITENLKELYNYLETDNLMLQMITDMINNKEYLNKKVNTKPLKELVNDEQGTIDEVIKAQDKEIVDDDDDDDDDEVWIKVKYKKIPYYIIKNENPQYIYNIIDNKKGVKVGYREIINNKKKYTLY